MVIKVYISGISASKEIKKRQQRALLILDSCKVDYESIDITEPGLEHMREFMVQNSKVREPNKTPLSPQFFNDDVYCGDYEDFDSAVEVNQVFPFLKLESHGKDFQYSFNDVNMKTTNGDHDKGDTRKSITPDKEENEEGEIIKDSNEMGEGEVGNDEAETKGEDEEGDDEFWAQDDSKKRKKEDDEIVEESKESNEEENETEDASKRLKTDGEEDKAEEDEVIEDEEEEAEVKEVEPEVESENVQEKKEEEEEEEEDDFWGGKGD